MMNKSAIIRKKNKWQTKTVYDTSLSLFKTILHLKCSTCTNNLKRTRAYKYLLICIEHLLCTWLYLKCVHTFLMWSSKQTRLGDRRYCSVSLWWVKAHCWVTFPENQQVTGRAGVQSLSRLTPKPMPVTPEHNCPP